MFTARLSTFRSSAGSKVSNTVVPRIRSSKRHITTYAWPTTTKEENGRQKVVDPGHIMSAFNAEEMASLKDLDPNSPLLTGSAPGHLGWGGGGKRLGSKLEQPVHFGGQDLIVGAVHNEGVPDWNRSTPRALEKAPIKIDHGTLPGPSVVALARQANEAASDLSYRTDRMSGSPAPFGTITGPEGKRRTMNCVGFDASTKQSIGMNIPTMHPNSRPQDLAEVVQHQRVGKVTGTPPSERK